MSKGLDRLFGGERTAMSEEPAEHAGPSNIAAKPSSPVVGANTLSTCRDLPIDALVDMEQPFHLYDTEELEAMRQSISAHGVIQRLIVRPYGEETYQIVSGRNRRTAARMAGYTAIPCEIRHLDDDEAQLQMLETNLQQRKNLLPSEKAWAFRLQLEAINRQGQRTDLTSPQGASKFRSDDEIGREVGMSGDTVRRHIRLTYLISSLLEAVDKKALGFVAGVSLSYLTPESQCAVQNFFYCMYSKPIDQHLAERLRAAGEDGELTEERIHALLNETTSRPKTIKSVPMRPFRKYFPKGTSQAALQKTMLAALQMYFEAGNNIIEK